MQTVTPQLIKDKKVLLRLDLDVPIKEGKVLEDFRLKAALPTINLCLEYAAETVMMGHIGRPGGVEVSELSVGPIFQWFKSQGYNHDLENDQLRLLENLRFEKGEDEEDLDYARQLASLGDFYVNEAFAAHHREASTTVLPTLLPHAAGLRFISEITKLNEIRLTPKRPLVVIIGGAKLEDKLPVVQVLSKVADTILVGGKLVEELKMGHHFLEPNVALAELNFDGTDISEETTNLWLKILQQAKMILWAGPLGKVEQEGRDQSRKIAQIIFDSGAESIIGGGDTITALSKWQMIDKFSFVSTGGGAMLKFLSSGTLPAIEALSW